MTPRNLVLLFIAALFAVGSVMFVRVHMKAPVATASVAKHADKVLVARQHIETGSFVKSAQDLEWGEWPAGSIQPGYIREGSEPMTNFDGAVARHPIETGEAITTNDIIKPGAGGFLSAVLNPGMRAVSIAVSATSGTSGFIFPGDHVDLIVTSHLKRKGNNGMGQQQDEVVSDTFIKNVRVVAVDQMLDNPDNKAILAKTVTVEVSPTQAQAIGVAEDLGKISFALRSIAVEAPVAVAADGQKPAAGVGGPLIPIGAEPEDMVTALTHPGAKDSNQDAYTSDSDISPRMHVVLVVRGDQSEEHEFFWDGKSQFGWGGQ